MRLTEAQYDQLAGKGQVRIYAVRAGDAPVPVERVWNCLRFESFTFRLPWAPSVNNCYANAKKGRVKSSKAREYRKMVWLAVLEQRVQRRILAHPMQIAITQHSSSARGDIDNGIKIVLDVLKQLDVIADDNREILKRLIVEDGARTKSPYIVVSVEPWP